MDYPEIDLQSSDELAIEQGTHVIRLNLVAGPDILFALDKLLRCCADYKIQLAHSLRKRVHLLRDDARFIKARREEDKLKRSRSESKDKTARLKEQREYIQSLAKEYCLDSQSVHDEAKGLRKLGIYLYLLNSQIAQRIAQDLLAGIGKVLSGEASDISVPKRSEVNTIVAKQDGIGLILGLYGGKVTVSFRGIVREMIQKDGDNKGKPNYLKVKRKVTVEATATRRSDAMDEIEALRPKYASYKFSGLANGYNPVRYCAIRRRLYEENGQVRHGYELLIVVTGRAPRRKGWRPIGEGKAGLDASTFAHTFVSEKEALIITPSPSMDKLAEKIADIQTQMDKIFRKANKDWFDEKGRFRRPKDMAIRAKGLDRPKEYLRLRWRIRLAWQRYRDTRKAEFNRVANLLVGKARVFVMEDMQYKGMQKRGHHEVTVTHKREDGTVAATTETQSFRRFGRSMVKASPGLFFEILEQKVLAAGGTFIRVNPADIKASQYNPLTGECVKHGLDERVIKVAEGIYVQRDLLAAYILMHAVRVEVEDPVEEPSKDDPESDEKNPLRKRLRTKAARKSRRRVKYAVDGEACRKGFMDFARRSEYTIRKALIEHRAMPTSVGLDEFRKIYGNICAREK